ncbi:hypothetical protein [Glutamicibacter sp. NPDC087583]|uniref:hypothetical protein n=1 Tax=Glutamicibacter sp. NPDC087583 TaxID=3363995 RepID=UPI003830D8BD
MNKAPAQPASKGTSEAFEPTLILARNAEEARRVRKDSGLRQKDCLIVGSVDCLRGWLTQTCPRIITPGFYLRRNAMEILGHLRFCDRFAQRQYTHEELLKNAIPVQK